MRPSGVAERWNQNHTVTARLAQVFWGLLPDG